jgi:hypothetical protein
MSIRTGYNGKRDGVPSSCALQHRSGRNSAGRGAASSGAAARDLQWRGWRLAGLPS